MDAAHDVLRKELAGLRTGRASVGLLDPVHVEAYGNTVSLKEIGSVSAPEPRLLLVNVWDKGNVKAAEKAIREAPLGLNPQVDGQTIRVPIPALSEERRKELTRVAAKYAEEARVSVRNVRRDGIEAILPKAVERAFLNQPRDARYERYYAAFASQPAEDYAFACAASALYDVEEQMRQIVSPTLVVAGEHDILLPPELSEQVAATIPGARFEIMPGAAHFVPYQTASAFAERIATFLAMLK